MWTTMARWLLALVSWVLMLAAQAQTGAVQGTVCNATGAPVPYAAVTIESLGIGTVTDSNGHYSLSTLPQGTYGLSCSRIDFATQSQMVAIAPGTSLTLDFTLSPRVNALEAIQVSGQSVAEEVRSSGFAVEVLETRSMKSLPTDINTLLNTTSGIHIRETGGVGAGFQLSLNGLTGNQVRYFIDGIPMESFGSALTLNNFPVNLIENIEVYKGVVPIHLGADALGGAVNITTAYHRQSFLDAAYTVGSFNTHIASFHAQHHNADRGHYWRVSSFLNHSDNTYRMDSVPVYDLTLGNRQGEIAQQRFHNAYTSGMTNVKFGVLDKAWADHWSAGVIGALNHKQYQHPDNNINRVFGHFHTANRTLLANSTYQKQFGSLMLTGFLQGGWIEERVVDTSNRKYNWAGDWVERDPSDPRGELFERQSLFRLRDAVWRSNLSAQYEFSNQHTVSLNVTQQFLRRTGEDEVDDYNRSFHSPNTLQKSILGLAYTFQSKNGRSEATLFGKQYGFRGRLVTQDYLNEDIVNEPQFRFTGYGGAFSWQPLPHLQLKTSLEQTFRLPESFEILGDGVYIQPNPALRPERSLNTNFGVRYQVEHEQWQVRTSTNFFYRFSRDFIRYNPIGPFGAFENLNHVRSLGVEGNIHLTYRELLQLQGSITWQDITDRTPFDEGLPNTNYKSRVPNIPYLFGNVRLGLSPWQADGLRSLTLYWNTRYVHNFFLMWENLGSRDHKHIIPHQLLHDVEAVLALRDGQYNLSLSVTNLLDASAFDHFNIQNPGRAVQVKMRYFLQPSKQ